MHAWQIVKPRRGHRAAAFLLRDGGGRFARMAWPRHGWESGMTDPGSVHFAGSPPAPALPFVLSNLIRGPSCNVGLGNSQWEPFTMCLKPE